MNKMDQENIADQENITTVDNGYFKNVVNAEIAKKIG